MDGGGWPGFGRNSSSQQGEGGQEMSRIGPLFRVWVLRVPSGVGPQPQVELRPGWEAVGDTAGAPQHLYTTVLG